ncbi:MAG TPA: hypothetical protein VJB41_03515 [Patescibacteria group bacterium]|nr:hypothetical protein [Patescibacteria group bacterium]
MPQQISLFESGNNWNLGKTPLEGGLKGELLGKFSWLINLKTLFL